MSPKTFMQLTFVHSFLGKVLFFPPTTNFSYFSTSDEGFLSLPADILKDFKIIKEASLRLGPSPQMNMMCNHLGQGAPGFTPMALKMHTEADKITVEADKKDLTDVMVATERTLQSCTNCHAAYKQQIVSEQEWNKILNKR